MIQRSFFLAVLTCAPVVAQDAARSTKPLAPSTNLHADWRIPIHTNHGDPELGAYGTWTSGASYKASFHDGFAFYPVLGAGYSTHLPLRWATKRVRVGERDLVQVTESTRGTQAHSDWRFEYRYGSVTEAYDVRPGGIEQTFVIHERPSQGGDLVVHGAVDTPLAAPKSGSRHGALTFRDADGKAIVRYGAAFVFDSRGRRKEIVTGFDGKNITLTVPASWLAAAAFPVTVDPYIHSGIMMGGKNKSVDLCHNGEGNRVLATFRRQVTSTDHDVYASVYTASLRHMGAVYADVSTIGSTDRAHSAYEGRSNRWVIAIGYSWATGTTTGSRVKVYHHDHANLRLNTGSTMPIPALRDHQDADPTIGGSGPFQGNGKVLLAFRRDKSPVPGDGPHSRVWVGRLDLVSLSRHVFRPLRDVPYVDQSSPSMNRQGMGGGWMVAFDELNRGNPGDAREIRFFRVTPSGSVHVGLQTVSGSRRDVHLFNPKVEGANGRWLCVYEEVRLNGRDHLITSQRINWSGSGPMQVARRWYSAPNPVTDRESRNVSYNSVTESHWTLGFCQRYGSDYRLRIHRAGFQGCFRYVDDHFADTSREPQAVALTFNSSYAYPHIAYTDRAGGIVNGGHFKFPAEARCRVVGSDCGGTTSCYNRGANHPYLGSEFFGIQVRNAVPNQPYVANVASGVRTSPLILSPGGCSQWLTSDYGMFATVTTNAKGQITVAAPLRECMLRFDVALQWFTFHDGVIKATNALDVTVR